MVYHCAVAQGRYGKRFLFDVCDALIFGYVMLLNSGKCQQSDDRFIVDKSIPNARHIIAWRAYKPFLACWK